MNSRTILTTVGAAALGVGIIIGGTTMPSVLAQEAPTTSESTVLAQETTPEARFAEAYDRFVATLASELNSDEAAVDAAIRTALKEQVAALESAGRLDAEEVAEIQQMIDESEVPFGFGMGGPGGFGGHGGMHGFAGHHDGFKGRGGEYRGPQGDVDEVGPAASAVPGSPAAGAAPATLPSSETPSDQTAPVDSASAENDAAF